mmetsp:Transcript_38343/g.87108  ORF Transcript_38343/g.87108 Transcript_38343/m.87108 type:complete len:84 (+) Transcript_38343:238-489(+)
MGLCAAKCNDQCLYTPRGAATEKLRAKSSRENIAAEPENRYALASVATCNKMCLQALTRHHHVEEHSQVYKMRRLLHQQAGLI